MLTHSSKEIPRFPRKSTPQLLLYPWIFLKNATAGYTLRNPACCRDAIPRWEPYQNMNVVFCNLTFLDPKIKMRGDLKQQCLDPSAASPNQDFWPALRTPHNVVPGLIHCMPCSPPHHKARAFKRILRKSIRVTFRKDDSVRTTAEPRRCSGSFIPGMSPRPEILDSQLRVDETLTGRISARLALK